MIVCSNCQYKNLTGALFCSECGLPLGGVDTITTQHISTAPVREETLRKYTGHSNTPLAHDQWVSLHLLDTGQVLPLAERTEFTLGRISEGQPINPDIDLSPYQAYASGVSRLHAMIKRDANRVLLMDLGSSNGTFINGKRLNPNMEHVLKNGDVVALGKLKMQILLNPGE